MRRAILWVHENGFPIAFLTLFGGCFLFCMGGLFSDNGLHGAPFTFHVWLVGETRFLGGVGALTGIGFGWAGAVRWAKRTPEPKKIAPIDPILEAARREVDAIAPEEP